MKKVVSLVMIVCLFVCVIMPTHALADVDLALMYAKKVCEIDAQHEGEDEVDVYTYIEALDLVLKAIDEIANEITTHYLYAMYGMISIEMKGGGSFDINIDEEIGSQFDILLAESNKRVAEWRSDILDDAAKCFANQRYDLRIIAIHATVIVYMTERVEEYVGTTSK